MEPPIEVLEVQVLLLRDQILIEYALRLAFKVINNIAKYKVLSKSLDLVREMKPKKLNMYSNSQLLVRQVND